MTIANMFNESLPKKVDIQCADSLRQILTPKNLSSGTPKIGITIDKEKPTDVVLTDAVARAFLDVLQLISSGRGVQMISYGADLNTQQAANLLNVPHSYLIKILDEGEIPYTHTRVSRCIKTKDLFAYKKKRDAERERLLTEMARIDSRYLFDT